MDFLNVQVAPVQLEPVEKLALLNLCLSLVQLHLKLLS